MTINRDLPMNNAENYLTYVAYYPVVGAFAGTAKVILGVTQTITALACAILCTLPCVMSGDYTLLNHNVRHIIHGLSNIPTGLLEAIPLVGTALWKLREYRLSRTDDLVVYPYSGQETKFLPYPSLVKYDFLDVDGQGQNAINRARELYTISVRENGGKQLDIPLKLREHLAWKAANQANHEILHPNGD